MKLPVVSFLKNDKNIYADDSKLHLKSASTSLMHVSNDSTIIDSQGVLYKIKRTYQTGWRYLWGYHPLQKGRTAKIDFERINK